MVLKPYYANGKQSIYLGDCRLLLPEFEIDTIVGDPQYGINLNTAYKDSQRGALAECNNFLPIHDDDKPFDPSHLLGYRRIVLFGANYYADKLPISAAWWVWDKRDKLISKRDNGTFNDNGECELIWTNCPGPIRIIYHRWMGMLKASEQNKRRVHPTQKPVDVMAQCIKWAKPKGLICDPYMGSGPTLKAAQYLNLECIGFEIVEQYCEIAAKRLQQNTFFELLEAAQ